MVKRFDLLADCSIGQTHCGDYVSYEDYQKAEQIGLHHRDEADKLRRKVHELEAERDELLAALEEVVAICDPESYASEVGKIALDKVKK